MWKSVYENLGKILDLLEKNPNIKLHEIFDDKDTLVQEDEGEELHQVSGNLMAFIIRLDDEYVKSLQSIDPHTQDYVSRLQDESALLELAQRTLVSWLLVKMYQLISQRYYQRHNQFQAAARIAMRIVEHTYYKSDVHLEKGETEESKQSQGEETVKQRKEGVDGHAVLDELAPLIYNYGDERLKTRLMLCKIYHHALHDHFYEVFLWILYLTLQG